MSQSEDNDGWFDDLEEEPPLLDLNKEQSSINEPKLVKGFSFKIFHENDIEARQNAMV